MRCPPLSRDVAIIIYSRGRADHLTRLLHDLHRSYLPALAEGGLSTCVCVYAQGYAQEYLDDLSRDFAPALAAGEMIVFPAEEAHTRIGGVAQAAFRRVHAACRYRLAMLMDDDSTFRHDARVCANLREAARRFIAERHRAYSIKLGDGDRLDYQPFVVGEAPIMPFREKMLWASRDVLDGVLAMPRFGELSIGEDAVIAALAWLGGPDLCFAVHGMGSFLHLSFEDEGGGNAEAIGGGYAELVGFPGEAARDPSATKYDAALRSGVTPYHVLPHVFVAEDHPHYEYNGIRPETAIRLRSRVGSAGPPLVAEGAFATPQG